MNLLLLSTNISSLLTLWGHKKNRKQKRHLTRSLTQWLIAEIVKFIVRLSDLILRKEKSIESLRKSIWLNSYLQLLFIVWLFCTCLHFFFFPAANMFRFEIADDIVSCAALYLINFYSGKVKKKISSLLVKWDLKVFWLKLRNFFFLNHYVFTRASNLTSVFKKIIIRT